MKYIRWFDEIDRYDFDAVGGKNANLGELNMLGINVPNGFAIIADVFRLFWSPDLHLIFAGMNHRDLKALKLDAVNAREIIYNAPWPNQLTEEILQASHVLNGKLAVRSSATNEDSPTASFAGQYDSYLNIEGDEALLEHCRLVFASIFNDRAIFYHKNRGYDPTISMMSVGVMEMVRSDLAASGIIFSDDMLITAAQGLGEDIVQGKVEVDEYYISRDDGSISNKFVKSIPACITDQDVAKLAELTFKIEDHWACLMDIEWAKDGINGQIYIVQARPITA